MPPANSSAEEFSQQVKDALQESELLDDVHGYRFGFSHSPEFVAFWQTFLTNKIIGKKWAHVEICERIYRAAERLRRISHPQETNKKTLHTILRQYIHAFCCNPVRILSRARSKDRIQCRMYDQACLLEMAILNDCPEGVNSLLNDPILDEIISHCLTPWSNPCGTRENGRFTIDCKQDLASLAAENGNTALLEKVFLHPSFQQQSIYHRHEAVEAALRGGHLDVVRFIMEPRWDLPGKGPYRTHSLNEHILVSGVFKSPSADFVTQLLGLIASRPMKTHGIEAVYPGHDTLLCLVARKSPQRVDVAERLLEQGALLKQKAHVKRRGAEASYTGSDSLLEQAIKGGNEEILRLLLNRGADARVLDNDGLEVAVKRGRLDIVRMLVENGTRVTPRLPSSGRKEHWRWTEDRLMAHAVLTENEALCRYLVERGAIVNEHALWAAADASLVSMVRFLVDVGAEINEQMIERAKRYSHPDVATILQAQHNST